MVEIKTTIDPRALDDMKILDQLNNEIKSIMVQLQNVTTTKKQIADLMGWIKEGKIAQVNEIMGGTLVVLFKDKEESTKNQLKTLQERWVSFDNVEKGLLEQKRYRSDQLCEQLSKIYRDTKGYLELYKAEHLLKASEPITIDSKTFTEELPSLKEAKK